MYQSSAEHHLDGIFQEEVRTYKDEILKYRTEPEDNIEKEKVLKTKS